MLSPGDKFPELSLSLLRNDQINLPADLAGGWAYIAFYRGHW
jgi:hypothetical protein